SPGTRRRVPAGPVEGEESGPHGRGDRLGPAADAEAPVDRDRVAASRRGCRGTPAPRARPPHGGHRWPCARRAASPHRPPGRRARPAVFLDRARGVGSTRARPAEREGPREPGGGDRTRTDNPLLAKQVRYQLRHAPGAGCRPGQPWSVTTSSVASAHRSRSACCSWSFLASATAPRATTASPSKRFTMTPGGSGVGLTGLEPVTSSLSGKRSNRLSYRPLRRAAGWLLAP